MPSQLIHRTVEFKIYPNKAQVALLTAWLRVCCWIYNRMLENRIKTHKRRGESSNYSGQCGLLTTWRSRMSWIAAVPSQFCRDALRRVDRGFQAFFRRCKSGDKPGFPRFRSHHRYNSLEVLASAKYLRCDRIFIPKIGEVRCRGGNQDVSGDQRLLRVIRRASGWYAQILFERKADPVVVAPEPIVGIDVGLEAFATLSNGEMVENPRCFRKAEKKLRVAQRRLSRKKKGSKNRTKARTRVAKIHERIASQRKSFAHQESRKIVNRFQVIGVENLNIKGMVRGLFPKAIHDAAWSMFTNYLTYKAENAGRQIVSVDPRGTSQECPNCGRVKKKELSERIHQCSCGCVMNRDHAAAIVIERRTAAGASAALSPVEDRPLLSECNESKLNRRIRQRLTVKV